MAEEAQLASTELALGSLDKELLLPEYGEDFTHVTQVLFQGRAVTQQVVHVHYHRSVQGPTRARDAGSPVAWQRRRAVSGGV